MSLIITSISNNGIVTITDSFTILAASLSNPEDERGPDARKCLDCPGLNAHLSFCGSLEIESIDIATWLPEFLSDCGATDIFRMAELLRDRLAAQVPCPKQIVHIVGFDESDGVKKAVFGHISSVNIIPSGYELKPEGFKLDWDMRPLPRENFVHDVKVFVNGFWSGRDAFKMIHETHWRIISKRDFRFRIPTIEIEAEVLKKEMDYISYLFQHSEHAVPFIGGKTQKLFMKW